MKTAPLFAFVLAAAAFGIAGCANEDHRLAEDQQSCVAMGHVEGTPEFKQCMADLNQRRCAEAKSKTEGTQHEATVDCTKL